MLELLKNFSPKTKSTIQNETKYSKTQTHDKFLTVSIDSDCIRVLAFYYDENENKTKIIGVGKKPLGTDLVRAGIVIDYEKTSEILKLAIEEAEGENSDPIKDVIFGVGGALSYGFVTTAKINRSETDTAIEKEEFDSIFNKIIESASTEAQNEMLQVNGDSEADLELITSSIVYSKIDGALTNDPVGKMAQTLEVSVFTAYTQAYQVLTLQKIAKKLHLNILAIGSEMYCITKQLRATKGKILDGIIINMDNDFTEIGVIFGGGIVNTKSLEIGGTQLNKIISKFTGLNTVEAEKMKRTYAYGKLTQTESDLIRNCLKDPINIWLEGIKLVFEEFTGVKTFSSQIFLVNEAAELPDIIEILNKEPWMKSIPFKEPPTYYKVAFKDLKGIEDSTGTLGSLEYITNASLSVIYLEMKGLFDA